MFMSEVAWVGCIEALRAFTLDAAWAAHQEDTLGTLEPGKWADFILVDRDPFTVHAARLWSTKVLETWVGGKRVFAAAPASVGSAPATHGREAKPDVD
jgi:predicted amidohydrolase YtcJ